MAVTETILEIPVTLELPVGPQHPALHEPVLLRIYADGEVVSRVEVNTGYNHRGVEKLLESVPYQRGIFVASRICGICNAVHSDCFIRALEELMGIEPPPRAKYLRVLAMELERIHSHMLIAAVAAELIGFDTLFMYIMRDRELVMKAKEILTGGRVHADYMMIGGVRRDIDDVKKERILKLLDRIEASLRSYLRVYQEDAVILRRLADVGRIKPSSALRASLVGPVLRGSGVKSDSRAEELYEAYSELDFEIVAREEGDALARMLVRLEEALVSVELCRQVLSKLPQGSAVVDERRLPPSIPQGEAYARVEAPRGELTYYVVGSGAAKPYRVKVRTPSLNNVVNGSFVYVGHTLADVPAILASFDPCISCMDRAIVKKRGETRVVKLRELAERGAGL
ncbi:MAG: nickel-dependent hydrogenase large subunit [Acidilobaceae archaeon]